MRSCWRAPRPQASGACASRAPSARARAFPALLTWWITAVAPKTKATQASSPARVIIPSRCLPAVEWSFGVKPIQAAKSRPERKARASETFIATAPTGPIAGMCQPPAHLVLPMPGHQLRFDPVRFGMIAVLLGQHREHSLANSGTAPSVQSSPAAARSCRAPWAHNPELGGMAANHVANCVRRSISCSRTPISISAACCSAVFTGTNRIRGRLMASQIARHRLHRSCRDPHRASHIAAAAAPPHGPAP